MVSFQDTPECSDALLKLSQEALGLADDLFQLQEVRTSLLKRNVTLTLSSAYFLRVM